MRARLLGTTALALALALACAPAEPPDTRAEDEAAVRAADTAFASAASSGDIEAIMGFVADDAVTLGANAPIQRGKAEIRAGFEQMLAMPGARVTWQPDTVVASRSGDLAYSYGTATMTMNGPDGTPMTEAMKYLTVWGKQADGSWKVVADAYNSDTPLPGMGG